MKKSIVTIVICMFGFLGIAQNQDPNSPVYDYNYTDSTQTTHDSTSTGAPVEDSDGMAAKMYQRVIMPFDSSTNLITYSGIMEQEESGSDSLYARAKRFAEKNLGKGKEMYEIDKRNQKLVVNGSIPAFAYINKYNKKSIGKYQFKITILVKEGRYKYTLTNFVHESEISASGGKPMRNYFEYYNNSTTNIQSYDKVLRYADKDIKETIQMLQIAMIEPKLSDEDDW
ncbi:MAG: DUF4468 domain-containing protein [Bacteroidetes bacterium]|nr:DUF4468 domain-containing protein [Bacteroidota bacterium]